MSASTQYHVDVYGKSRVGLDVHGKRVVSDLSIWNLVCTGDHMYANRGIQTWNQLCKCGASERYINVKWFPNRQTMI